MILLISVSSVNLPDKWIINLERSDVFGENSNSFGDKRNELNIYNKEDLDADNVRHYIL